MMDPIKFNRVRFLRVEAVMGVNVQSDQMDKNWVNRFKINALVTKDSRLNQSPQKLAVVVKKLAVVEEWAVAAPRKNKSIRKMNHQIWENQTEAKMPRNKKKLLKKQKEVEKGQDWKLWFQAKGIIREIKEELKKITNLVQNPKENTLISQLLKGLRDHLLAEARRPVKIRLKVKIAKIRTIKVFLEKRSKVRMIRFIQIVLSTNQPLIIEQIDMTKKREREEAAVHQIEEAQDHLKWLTTRIQSRAKKERNEFATNEFLQNGTSTMTALDP